MIWQVARVLSRDGDRLTLVFSAPEQCRRCARGEGCGAGVYSRLFGRRETHLVLASGVGAARDDWVRVGLEPSRLAMAAGLHYGFPLAGFLLGAIVGQAAMSGGLAGDLVALGSGLAGFSITGAVVARRLHPALNPVIERLSCTDGDTNSSLS